MSWICKCDRCGTIIKDFPDEGMTIEVTDLNKNKEEYMKHICPTCSQSFYYWINKIDPDDFITVGIYRN